MPFVLAGLLQAYARRGPAATAALFTQTPQRPDRKTALLGGRSRVLQLGKTLFHTWAITAGIMAAPGGETVVVSAKRMQSRAGSPTRECIDLAQSR